MKKMAFSIITLGALSLAACGAPVDDTTVTPPAPAPSWQEEGSAAPVPTSDTAGTTSSPTPAPAPAPAPTPAPSSGADVKVDVKTNVSAGVKKAQVLTLDAGNMYFKPNAMTVKLNQPVTVNYTNKGRHTFSVDELGINISLQNASGSFTFTPTKAGTFAMYCAIPGHRAGGMEGTLTVTAQ